MAAATALVNYAKYQRDLAELLSQRREPAALSERRRQSLRRYESLGMPSSRSEAWRFTDISSLEQTDFERAGYVPVDPILLPRVEGHYNRLVFVNGCFVPGLSQLETVPARGLIVSLRHAVLRHPELLEVHLDCLRGLEEHPFAALNGAFWEDGALFHLSREASLEHPLHLVFFTAGTGTVSYPRNLIVLEEAAQATVIEHFRGEGRYLGCPVTEIALAAGARLEHYRIQEESLQAWHLGGMRLSQARNSRFEGYLLSSGGSLARTDSFALMDGEGAECELNGLTLVGEQQLADQHLRVEHAKPHTASRQVFKAVLQGKSRAVFDGLIHVCKEAQKTDASQINRNLLLSSQALVNSNPRLEILADDVKCSHGSSTGFLDTDALFYLRSRGIGENEARAMLVYAFANEVVEGFRLAPLRRLAEERLARRLIPDSAEREST
jgi:Fe-S cluster assembly protein SufD